MRALLFRVKLNNLTTGPGRAEIPLGVICKHIGG